jgi:hypothetical protein
MIGILGAYGTIGIWATRFIKKQSDCKIRIGGRNIDKAPQELHEEWPNTEWVKVDASAKESVEKFIDGCKIILDCAKLSEAQVSLMDEIAEVKGIPILHLGIVGYRKKESKVALIYGAGSIPGLSGLIPQYLAKQFDSVSALDFYYGGVGAFSYTAAKDYIEGIYNESNHSMVYWKDGNIVPFEPSANDINAEFNEFVSNYKLFPYFDEEATEITNKLQLIEARFQMCLSGKRTLDTLNNARQQYKQNPEATVESLCLASKLDTFGQRENTFFHCIMEGKMNNENAKFSLTAFGLPPARMTGTAAAAATLCVLKEKNYGGTQLLGESDLATQVIDTMTDGEPLFHCKIRNLNNIEIEGEI